MKIFNLHGYKGNPHNAAYSAWKELGYEVASPSFDYDDENIFGIVNYKYADNQPDIICGTSLGGFFATFLAEMYHTPLILVNPCILPFYWLQTLDYKGDLVKFVEPFGKFTKIEKDRVWTIVGGSDEVITTHEFDKQLFGDRHFRVIPEGTHSGSTLPLKEFFEEAMHYYTVVLPRKEGAECIAFYPDDED